MADKDKDYKVGFGKPPRESQFQKGASGNPSGRPKGAKNLFTMAQKEANRRITITENGTAKTVLKSEAIIKQFMNKAVGGDSKAAGIVLPLLSVSAQLTEDKTPSSPEEELKMLQELLGIKKGGNDDN